MPDLPDHGSLMMAIGGLSATLDDVKRRLDHQDKILDKLTTAYNVQAGKSSMAKTLFTLVAGGTGAGLVKLAEWLTHNGGNTPP